MRTIRRVSLKLNKAKWQALKELAKRYAREKDKHLLVYNSDQQFAQSESERKQRDGLIARKYVNPNGLQARMWKMAHKDAYETVVRQWSAIADGLKARVKRDWTEAQKHYAFWLLKSPLRQAQLSCGLADIPTHFVISNADQQPVRNYLRRTTRRQRGQRPRVKIARSMAFDEGMYEVITHNGRQYIKLMGLKPRQRIVIPLTGNTPIRGNIRVVLDFENERIEVHYTATVKAMPRLTGDICGLDAGVSEVFTDDLGNQYGLGFGQTLGEISQKLNDKGRKRNKLHQLAKKAKAKGNWRKAKRIKKFNLGQKKLNRTRRKARTELARQINTAVNQVLKKRQPSVMVTEKLDIRGKAKSKRVSRLVSLWTRSILKDRVEFMASARGSRREQVNPAYSSQMCPICGYVQRDNRKGDRFQCIRCKHADHADRVAAKNLKARKDDPEIFLYTPKERVKAILLARFTARLERDNPTVSGRTPDTVSGPSESETAQAILC